MKLGKIYFIKALIFDFDGTLIDTMGGFGVMASKVIHKHYGLPIEEAKRRYLLTSGVPFFQQLELMFPNDPKNDAATEEYECEKIKYLFSESIDDILLRFFKRFREKYSNMKLVISSNNFQHLIDEFIKKNEITVFDLVLGYKPNFSKGTDHFNYVKEYFGLKDSEIVFVGDSLLDARRAFDNNIAFIALVGTFSRAEWQRYNSDIVVIDNLEELETVIKEKNAGYNISCG